MWLKGEADITEFRIAQSYCDHDINVLSEQVLAHRQQDGHRLQHPGHPLPAPHRSLLSLHHLSHHPRHSQEISAQLEVGGQWQSPGGKREVP